MIELVILILASLSIASFIIRYQLCQEVSAERLKNGKRLLVWWLIFGLCLLIFYLGLEAIAFLAIALIVWTTFELFQILNIKLTIYHAAYTGSVMTVILYCVFIKPEQSQIIFIFSLIVALCAYFLSLSSKMLVPTLWLSCCLAISSILLIAVLADKSNADYAHILLFLFFITAVNDVAQYVFGALFGKTAIAPLLSPNKTFEGFLGGLVTTGLFCAILLPHVFVISWEWSLAIGIILSLAGFLGDLNISKLKRAVNIKDSATSIPGHGGILDRIDSLMMILPVFGLIMTML